MTEASQPKKVIVVGAGWAGLGATYHLAKQGYDVTLLEAGSYPGGLVAGWKTPGGRSVEAGIHGFWYPYRNIFSLINELKINPFTSWTRSSQYSPAGLEVESPIFQDLPQLPTPLGTFIYTQFKRLPLIDRLSALPLLYAVIDFDNSDAAWRRYDFVTARELFKDFGVSARLYSESFEPMLLVGLFAPGEQCSAAATLGMLYFFILAHQPDFDVVWCRGTVGEKIFRPWIQHIEKLGGRFLTSKRVTDLIIDTNNRATGVVCGEEVFDADAVIFAVGVTGMKKIVSSSSSLQTRAEFRNLNNLGAIDVLATRLWFDRKITIPRPSNACFGFDQTTGWTFFDLNALHDEYQHESGTVVEVDFYHANQFIPLEDQDIVSIVQRYLATCIPEFQQAKVIDHSVIRLPQAVTHFAPGSYRYMLPAKTSVKNVFMSGDWIISCHGSWSQEKAYVTGLEAANLVISHLGEGTPAQILPVAADEPHIQLARTVNRTVRHVSKSILPNFWLP
ncbi:hydroxysqualene dehydroxylase [Fischerella thermalis]|uniref:hydroxysqualene dehydroxylase n=2 Tax=Fischerella thermalis TaxID=372787 RepID=UPI000C7FB75E|nr:FAD-dependent oxidoreductase [Fischerella thermalis]PMB06500.1 amine oxidase [Fischerella thermalis CCMEE 5273]PMB07651.1 amine oxidase [Fischerella thermalis CCMEE 5328]MBF1988485.1 FAD-dependent oxidoreductase [Fischerella thermalis M58_A2018_009]MBF2058785.1 FAD-dependent oxidoreductase [Fischerella thermalis M66_A2018_004]MBF2070175.1 FAD-dependent oxidoreductase [Fischerella thermalis M48_A2018_028]